MRRERPQDQLKRSGPLGRLVGFKWVRRDDYMAVLRVPRWLSETELQRLADKLTADFLLAWPDQPPKVTAHGRLIRIEWAHE